MACPATIPMLAMLCLMSTQLPSITALSMPHAATLAINPLEIRASTCPDSTYSACSLVDSRLPGNMCCPGGSFCISSDSGSSAVCCPTGTNSTCTAIQPLLNCSVSSQDANANPTAQIFTTRLSDKLGSCGNSCCPFGYNCNNDAKNLTCVMDIGASSYAPGFHFGSSSSSATSPSPTSPTGSSSVTPVGSNSSRTSGIDSSTPRPTMQSSQFPPAAVAVGFFPGMILGALMAVLLILWCGRSRKNASRPPSDAGMAPKPYYRGQDISAPIPMEAQSTRSDFIRRTTLKAKSMLRSPRFTGSTSPYTEENWKMPTPPAVSNIPSEPASRMMPVTPERQRRDNLGISKEPSTESITVYSPPSGMGPPSRPIVPVRGMSAQRGAPVDSAIGSPFKTPPTRDNTYHDATTTNHNETLSPMRYDGGIVREDPNQPAGSAGRPTTTFTEMLRGIDFPDPLGSAKGTHPVPAVPPIPRGLDVRGKGNGRMW